MSLLRLRKYVKRIVDHRAIASVVNTVSITKSVVVETALFSYNNNIWSPTR